MKLFTQEEAGATDLAWGLRGLADVDWTSVDLL